MQDRPTDKNFRAMLKALYGKLRSKCGGQETAALVTRVSHQSISRYCVIHEDGIDTDPHHMPVDVAMDLMLFSGDFRLLKAMADHAGFVCVPKANATSANNVINLVGAFSRGAGALTDEALQAVADGTIDEHERAALLQHVKDEMERLATIGRTVERAAG